ncbi:hypothetical protein CBS101457_006565 [Exobasidium rhododendri]|nr:hypothetical protein CBS101457_006565 [Exobasidium rhododendri]
MMWTTLGRQMRSKSKKSYSYYTGSILILSAAAIVAILLQSFNMLPVRLHLSQRCRMSRMWPSYKQYEIDSSSGLSAKYKLFLYREAQPGAEHLNDKESRGRPALFVPGNAGSFGQVRSVASSAHHLYQSGQGGEETVEVDWWTVDFNEDFSAFHGQTMQEQAVYLNEVIEFLLKKYPQSKQIPVLGHSMGGVVARLMLTKANHPPGSVDTIITLSSPHAYPPVPLESGVEEVYRQINSGWEEKARDILLISLSGGVLDNQLSSEPASLPLARLWHDNTSLSAFTSSLPALWSGVDHLAMMWCDQLRERVARGVLRIEGRRSSVTERRQEWRRMIGMEASDNDSISFSGKAYLDSLPNTLKVAIYKVENDGQDLYEAFELMTSLGAGLDSSFGPPIDQEAQIRVDLCTIENSKVLCRHVAPSAYDLYPPSSHVSEEGEATFPKAEVRYEIPGQGLRRLRLSLTQLKRMRVVMIRIEKRQETKSDLTVAGWVPKTPTMDGYPSVLGGLVVPFKGSSNGPSKQVDLPDIDNSLLAYDISVLSSDQYEPSCRSNAAPILRFQSKSTGDTQYYPSISSGSRHTLTLHSTSPFMPPSLSTRRGMRITLILDTCDQYRGIYMTVNWRTSVGLLLSRYRMVLGSFPLAVLTFSASHMWDEWELGGEQLSFSPPPCPFLSLPGTFPDLTSTLLQYRWSLVILIVGSASISAFQTLATMSRAPAFLLPPSLQNLSFGIAASPFLASVALAIVFLTASNGLALLVSLLLDGVIAALGALVRLTGRRSGYDQRFIEKDDILHRPRSTIVSFTILALSVYLLVPVQFVFLALFLLQILSTIRAYAAVHDASDGREISRLHQQKWLLNLYFWLLPLNAPALLIWTRNLTHGWYGTLGGSDHNFLSVLGFLAVSKISSSGDILQHGRSRPVSVLTQGLMIVFSVYALAYGIRYTYSLFTLVNCILTWLAVVHFKTKYAQSIERRNVVETDNQHEEREAFIAKRELHSAIPQELRASDVVPDSLTSSFKQHDGYTLHQEGDEVEEAIEERGEVDLNIESKEAGSRDELLERYLNILDEYFAGKKAVSEHFTSGHFQLSKARMQLGRLTSMNNSWDARMKANRMIRFKHDGTSAAMEKSEPSDLRDDEKGTLMTTEMQESQQSLLRRRQGGVPVHEDVQEAKSGLRGVSGKEPKKEGEQTTKKKAQPFDPLYQFAALPPPSLRTAQAEFISALEGMIGTPSSRGLLAIQSDLHQLEKRIAAVQ